MSESLENKIINAAHLIEPSTEFSEKLWEEIKRTPLQAPAPRRAPHWRWLPVTVVFVLAVILIAVSPQAVLAGLRSLFDFLPGIGLVQNDTSTLYLAEPIVVEQDGLTLTIEQIVADANKTVISYRIDNLPTAGTPSCCYNDSQLLLPDGTALLPIGGGVSCEQTYTEARVEFMPLPEGVTQAALLANLKFPEAACTALPAWEVEFSLGTTKPTDIEFLPVVDEPTETTGGSAPESSGETTAEAAQSDVQFIVDHTVILEDGYLLYGHIEYTDAHWIGVGLNGTSLSGTDAAGKAVPLEPSTESILDNEFVIKVATKDFASPLTLHVQSLWVSAKYENPTTFSFDADADPQVGQSWDLNQEIDLDGNQITVLSVQVVQEPADVAQDTPNKGYGIEFNTATEYFNGQIICEGQGEATAIWGQSRAIHGTNQLFETYYSDGLPHGLVSCRFWHVHYLSPGTWEFEWQPPDPTE
ncbi:MAG: DUF4179 domain-containing protein [Anaerolineales bacterium]|nr:DUF4179 domain-containing protein [Anaerolineales bacterium]